MQSVLDVPAYFVEVLVIIANSVLQKMSFATSVRNRVILSKFVNQSVNKQLLIQLFQPIQN